MQTYLPFAGFAQSAKVLSTKHLERQRTDVMRILKKIEARPGIRLGWHNHPAVEMWRNSHDALCWYGMAICAEWASRNNSSDDLFASISMRLTAHGQWTKPAWIGNPGLHSAYRSFLLYQDPDWYGQFGWEEQPLAQFTAWPSLQ